MSENTTLTFDTSNIMSPFEDDIVVVLSELGQFLMKQGRTSPDIVAAGYWLRKSHLISLKKQYLFESNKQLLTAKGVIVHFAPSNVDTLFFYSMMVSVLCGNLTVLRLSTTLSNEALKLIEHLNCFFQQHCQQKNDQQHKYQKIYSLVHLIQYNHDDEITKALSLLADVRVIWGSNKTVNKISEMPQKLAASNLCFPDRYSVAVIQLANENQVAGAVNQLLADIKPFNQQGCSSPKVIYWLDPEHSLPSLSLQHLFWQELAKQLNQEITLTTSESLAQLLYQQCLAILAANIDTCQIKTGVLVHVSVEKVLPEMITAHTGHFILLQQNIMTLDEIILQEHCQTVTMFGVEETQWQQWVNKGTQPMKRWVKSGQALVFSHQWDGIDLIESFTRSTVLVK